MPCQALALDGDSTRGKACWFAGKDAARNFIINCDMILDSFKHVAVDHESPHWRRCKPVATLFLLVPLVDSFVLVMGLHIS